MGACLLTKIFRVSGFVKTDFHLWLWVTLNLYWRRFRDGMLPYCRILFCRIPFRRILFCRFLFRRFLFCRILFRRFQTPPGENTGMKHWSVRNPRLDCHLLVTCARNDAEFNNRADNMMRKSEFEFRRQSRLYTAWSAVRTMMEIGDATDSVLSLVGILT